MRHEDLIEPRNCRVRRRHGIQKDQQKRGQYSHRPSCCFQKLEPKQAPDKCFGKKAPSTIHSFYLLTQNVGLQSSTKRSYTGISHFCLGDQQRMQSLSVTDDVLSTSLFELLPVRLDVCCPTPHNLAKVADGDGGRDRTRQSRPDCLKMCV